MGTKKMYSLPSYLLLHVYDPFSYVNVNSKTQSGLVNGLKGNSLKILFLQQKLSRSLLKRVKHVTAASNKHLSMYLSHHSTL